MWRMGLVAPRHMGSSRTRARTHVPCIGRWILNHCATGEAPLLLLISSFILLLENILCMILILLNLLRPIVWPRIWSILDNVLCKLEKNVSYSLGGMFYSIRSNWFVVLFNLLFPC